MPASGRRRRRDPADPALVSLAAIVLCMRPIESLEFGEDSQARLMRNHAPKLSHVKGHRLHEIKRPTKRGRHPKQEKPPAIAPRELPPKIGGKLHELRKARRLTLEQVQAMSGISKSMLSQIERGKANPTFATLWHLTQSLGIDIGDLVYKVKLAAGRSREMEHMRIHSTPSVTSIDGKCKFRILSPRRLMLPLEWYEITIAPGGGSRANAHGNGSWEHVTCVKGSLTIEVGDEDVVLQEGETLRYMAEVPHGVRNDSKHVVKAIMVLIPLKEFGGSFHMPSRIDVEGVD